MDVELRCRGCSIEFWINLHEDAMRCPECGSADLEYLYFDWSQFGCG